MSKLHVPDSFQGFFSRHERTREQMKKKAERARKTAERKQVVQAKVDKKKSSRNLRYAKKVFAWAEAFKASEIGQRALASIPPDYRIEDRGIVFFVWQGSYDLSTSPKGVRWYRFGPGSEEQYCSTPEELAKIHPYNLLPAAAKAVKTGEVWEWVKEDLALFTKKEE